MQFTGVPYPITKHPLGFFRSQSGIDQVKSDLLVLLLTNPGERVMLPDFGTPLRKLVFEQNDTILRMQARDMIVEAIRRWEPRIVIEAIEVTGAQEDNLNPDDDLDDLDYVLQINIKFFDPNNIQDIQSLVLQLPLASSPQSSVAKPLQQSRSQEGGTNEV